MFNKVYLTFSYNCYDHSERFGATRAIDQSLHSSSNEYLSPFPVNTYHLSYFSNDKSSPHLNNERTGRAYINVGIHDFDGE